MSLLQQLDNLKKQKKKGLAVLLDPDKVQMNQLDSFVRLCEQLHVTFFFVGGSLISSDSLSALISRLKKLTKIPVILFPANAQHTHNEADALLFLSLISGRNPEFLIGHHVIAAPAIKRSKIEVIPTGYMLIESGRQTTASYISNTTPLPADKPDVALATALAGELLGLKTIYMDAGSGALNPVPEKMIQTVAKGIDVPLIVGGGIRTPEMAYRAYKAGADVLVIGNALEQNEAFLYELQNVIIEFSTNTLASSK